MSRTIIDEKRDRRCDRAEKMERRRQRRDKINRRQFEAGPLAFHLVKPLPKWN